MKMLPNGNYEAVVCPIQHKCSQDDFTCTEYSWKEGLHLQFEYGDPYEDGYSTEIQVQFCPFCGYEYKR